MDKIYIVDAVNVLFRSYYAIGHMTSPKGESTNALYGFVRSIYKLIKDFSPHYFVAVFDGPDNKKRRTDLYAEYKSHRKGMPEDLFPQLEKALEFCKLAGIPYLSVPGVEADDTMGSIAKWAEKKHATVFLCSSDKDLCQLISEHIFVINIQKDNLLVDQEKVKELFGVRADQMIDYLAIVGDASDNIPGLEGFGPKTAATLLEQFGTLEELLAHPEKVAGQKKQETLLKGKEIALLSRQLATIHLDVDFPNEEAFFKLGVPDHDNLKAFYQDAHFMSLLKELDAGAGQNTHDTKDKKEDKIEYVLVNDELSLDALIEELLKHKELSIDTETTDIRPMCARIVGLSFCTHPGKAWYIPFNGSLKKEEILKKLSRLFDNPKTSFYGHNIKYDMHVLLNEGISLKNICFDTIVASYLTTPQNQRHNLDLLSLEKFGKVKISIEDLIGKGKNQISMQEVLLEKISAYCCEDADYTSRLKQLFEKELKKEDLTEVFEKIELPLIPILCRMERAGIYVDLKKLEHLSKELSHLLNQLQEEIYALAGETFNLNSPKQLSGILFEKMGIKPPKKTLTGFSTSADVLESLKDSSPIIEKILDYRTFEKLRSTYVDTLPQQVLQTTGRIHCTFNQTVAATGRLSCQDPNLQNIPVRSKVGLKIREAFCPQHEGWSFISADYSQIELRLLAHLSEDPILIHAFNEGEDIHAYTASLVFNVPLKEVSEEMRYRAKAVNFGILYGQQAFGLSQGLSINYKEAASFIETYFQRYKKVKEFLEFCKESARKTGKAVTMTGRQRPIPEINSKNPMIRAAAERLAINTPLQGTAADLIKLAMIQIDEALQKQSHQVPRGTMLLQIHDELLFEAPDSEIESLSRLVKNLMENVFTLKVPLLVDISIGKNWGEC